MPTVAIQKNDKIVAAGETAAFALSRYARPQHPPIRPVAMS